MRVVERLSRALGFNRQRVDAAFQFLGDAGINRAMNVDPALALEGGRHDLDPEMSFTALAPAAMAAMVF